MNGFYRFTEFKWIKMLFVSLAIACILPCYSYAEKLNYPELLSDWLPVPLPESDKNQAFAELIKNSPYEWYVVSQNGQVHIKLINRDTDSFAKQKPPFKTWIGGEIGDSVSHAIKVKNGWLVGFNHGEWGGALYWYSHDGKKHQKISDAQIREFFHSPEGIFATEGVYHTMYMQGSVIRITPISSSPYWRTDTVMNLSNRIFNKSDNNYYAEPHSLSYGIRGAFTELKIAWGWRPTYTLAFSKNEQTLYIGMRHFIGKFDVKTKKLELLVPSQSFVDAINQLK